ncbi:MAG: M48 family metallopeptidase [Nitrososphaeraceae archaeon]
MAKAPQDVLDYIILHELCHLKIKEHSHHYWDYVRRYMPNYQEKIEWLKISGNHLIKIFMFAPNFLSEKLAVFNSPSFCIPLY